MEIVLIKAQGRDVTVEKYSPPKVGARATPAPGILLLHEVYGLLDCYREDAQDLANRGYVVYLPDLYTGGSRQYCVRALFTIAAMKNRPDNGPNLEIHDLLDALKADSDCNGEMGMIGACLTGGFVLHMAKREDMKAPVIYHHSLGLEGSGVPKGDSLDDIELLQAHWSKVDPFCPAKRRNQLIKELGDRIEPYVYNLPHGFRSVSRGLKGAELVWSRTVDFFERQLKQA